MIFQQRGWGKGIGRFLAKHLYEEGCVLGALTFKRSTHERILHQTDAKYELILSNDEIMSRPKDYLDGDVFSLAEICKELGVESIWPIVYTLRNHVKSYKDKYYYSFKQNVPDDEIIDYVMAVYKCIKVFFGSFRPDMIVSPNFVSLPHIMFNLYARQKGIPMMAITDVKIQGYYISTYQYQDKKGPFYDRVDELNEKREETSNREAARKYIDEFREKFKKPTYMDLFEDESESLWRKFRHELAPYAQIARWYIKKPIDVLESTGITIDYRPPRIILRDHYCKKLYKRFMKKFNYYPFEKLGKFVYFPLQVQPEASVDVAAPYFSNQVEAARLTAMSLPDDYTLAVREHPAMVGMRTPAYIKKLDRTVNIKMIDYRIPNEEVMKKASLIVSPNGTTITEAAFLRVPVIQLGDLGTTMKLPNVFHHTDMATLTPKIKEALKADLHNDEYERRLENYVAAAFDTGLEFDYYKAWERGTEDLGRLWVFYKKEIENNLK